MTDLEFDVLDELYFVCSYSQLKAAVEVQDEDLKNVLIELYSKKWISCYSDVDQEIDESKVDLENECDTYLYLATKKGLFKHNS
ncbi:transporter [Sediminitomix flava]|uniref:TFIIE alpha subunit n=1 Tax=Sediminitomix flava TaxID=379075 RepID=A0A315ZA10_SEDFL|nr:transporter [Sediminitomix flava]PWJ42371.1 hypothetical protein BC781_103623 [Sediminitomix flava]